MLGSADSRPDKATSSKSPSRLQKNCDFVHLAWFIKSLVAFHHISTSWVAQPLVWHVIKPSLLQIPKMEHTKNCFQPQKTKKPTKPTEASLAKRLAELLWILPFMFSLTLQPALPARKSTVPQCRRHSDWQGGAPGHRENLRWGMGKNARLAAVVLMEHSKNDRKRRVCGFQIIHGGSIQIIWMNCIPR